MSASEPARQAAPSEWHEYDCGVAGGFPHSSDLCQTNESAPSQKTTVRAIAGALDGFGGFLRCETCRRVEPLGDVGHKLGHGWPKCCGYTMRWWTQRQIDAGEVPR